MIVYRDTTYCAHSSHCYRYACPHRIGLEGEQEAIKMGLPVALGYFEGTERCAGRISVTEINSELER